MEAMTIALFGEAEKGEFRTAYYCQTLPQLQEFLGNPPAESLGLYYAIQALLFQRQVIFFRVKEEGFSIQDYQHSMHLLKNQTLFPELSAICAPGVGDFRIIHEMADLCFIFKSILIATESDLYDYLTSQKSA
jgi:hypothetical protein